MPRRYNPYEMLLMFGAWLLGCAYLATAPPPSTVVALFPGWVVIPWSVLLLVSGMTAITGAVWRGRLVVALAIERLGVLANAAALLLFEGATVWAATERLLPTFPWFSVVFLAAWMGADLWRDRQIADQLDDLTQPAQPPGTDP